MEPAGILQNTASGRYHPIVFRAAPLPSESYSEFGPMRYKSRGHHTAGFDTAELAVAEIKARGWSWTEMVWEWDGEGVPAIVSWFRR